MTARPLPAGLPPAQVRELAAVLHRAKRGCTTQPDLFFAPDSFEDEPAASHAARVTAAREICAPCPVRLACLAYALKTAPGGGVWAGLDADAGELAYLTRATRWPAQAPADRFRTATTARPETPEAAA
jgi:hypothetical protein